MTMSTPPHPPKRFFFASLLHVSQLSRRKVVYNNNVVIFGSPLLTLRVGDAPDYNRRAVYSSGSETSALVFEYIVQV